VRNDTDAIVAVLALDPVRAEHDRQPDDEQDGHQLLPVVERSRW